MYINVFIGHRVVYIFNIDYVEDDNHETRLIISFREFVLWGIKKKSSISVSMSLYYLTMLGSCGVKPRIFEMVNDRHNRGGWVDLGHRVKGVYILPSLRWKSSFNFLFANS